MNEYQYPFQKLALWTNCRELVKFVYRVTKNYPKEELFGLTNQMRRASVSVPSNLTEGASRLSRKDQKRFYQISYSSIMELLCQFYLSHDLKYIDDSILNESKEIIGKLSSMINNLQKTTH